MAQRGLDDERETHHILPQQGEGRHGIAGGQKVLDDGEPFIGIGSEQLFVLIDIVLCVLQVGPGKLPVLFEKIREELDRAVALPGDLIAVRGDKGKPVDGMGKVEGKQRPAALLFPGDGLGLRYRLVSRRELRRDLPAGKPFRLGIPGPGERNAPFIDGARYDAVVPVALSDAALEGPVVPDLGDTVLERLDRQPAVLDRRLSYPGRSRTESPR